MVRIALAGLAAAAALTIAAPASAQDRSQIRCESQNYRPTSCAVPGLTDARVVQQLGGRCVEGQTWTANRQGISVNNGCRAVFEVRVAGYGGGPGYPGGAYPGGGASNAGVIRCESQNYRQARCPVDTRGGVQLRQTLGNSPCRQGQTWGFDRGGVWVTNGCRAEFIVGGGYPGGGYPGGGNARTVDCSSQNYRPARCPVGNIRNVQVERVLGGECIQGRTWDFDRNAIRVNNGCRARFRVF